MYITHGNYVITLELSIMYTFNFYCKKNKDHSNFNSPHGTFSNHDEKLQDNRMWVVDVIGLSQLGKCSLHSCKGDNFLFLMNMH